MKKTVALVLSAILMLSLLAGCGESAVFETSKNAGNCKEVLKEGRSYQYKDMKFTFDGVLEYENKTKLDDPKGKWVEVDLSMKGSKLNETDLDKLVSDENILLNGAAAAKYNVSIPAGTVVSLNGNTGSMEDPENYLICIYYDVPEDFNVKSTKVTCFDEVKNV